MASSLPNNQPALPAAAAAESFDDDNDYDKLNDEDWQDMPTASSLTAHPNQSASPRHDTGTPTPILTKQEAATAGSSGSQTPVHTAGASDNSLRLRLDDHLHSNHPISSSSSSSLGAALDSPPVPDSASSSSSDFSLLNPSVASSIDQSHRNSVTALSTSSEQPSPSLLSLTPTSTVDSTSASPSQDQQPLAVSPRGEDGMPASILTGSQDKAKPSLQDNAIVGLAEETMVHPVAVHSTQCPPPLLVTQFDTSMDGDAETTLFKKSQIPPAIPSSSATAAVTTTKDAPEQFVPSSPLSEARKETLSSKSIGSDAKQDEAIISAETTPSSLSSTSTSTAPQSNVEPMDAPSPRQRYRTTVEDAPTSSEDEGARGTHGSGMRRRKKSLQNATPSPADAFGQYAMPGALNLELENLGLGSHFAAQSRQPSDPQPPMEERQCRICLGGADEVDLGRLISPCMCKGSMKYVHVECLNEWRARSQKRESHYKCDTCKYEFSFRRTSLAKYLVHPATLFILTILVFAVAVFAAGFVMKLLMYMFMEEFEMPLEMENAGLDENKVIQMAEDKIVFRPPDSLRAVFRIDSTHMVFGSLLVSVVGFLQLLVSAVLMGGGGHVFQIGGFGLGGRRRGGRGAQQGEAGISTILLVLILVFGLFKSLYVTYQFVRGQTRKALAKAEMMVLDVQ